MRVAPEIAATDTVFNSVAAICEGGQAGPTPASRANSLSLPSLDCRKGRSTTLLNLLIR